MDILAGIYAPGSADARGRLGGRVANGGPDGGTEQTVVGPLALVTNGAVWRDDEAGAGCALVGSVYNLIELCERLGVEPVGPARAAYLAHSRWGEAALGHLRGAFVIAVWTDHGQRLLLAQDQAGVQALFLHDQDARLTFGSEVRDVLRILPATPAPDETALVLKLGMQPLREGRTLYAGIRRLGAGRLLVADQRGRQERTYWSPSYRPPLEGSRLEIAAEARRALARAVDLRTRGIDRIGITLSGGFDSSAVAATVARNRPAGDAPLRGYSAVFPDDPAMDDRDLLDALVDELPIDNVRFSVAPGGVFGVSLDYLRDWKLPLSGPGWVVERALMQRAASEGTQIMLDGQGGDELFGSSYFLLADLVRSGRLGAAVELIRRRFPRAHEGVPWRGLARALAHYGIRPALPHGLYASLRSARGPARHAPAFMSESAARIHGASTEGLAWARGSSEPRWWLDLRAMLLEHREAAGLGDYIRQRASWVGIEARPPLFDPDLIEFALTIPPDLAFDSYLDRPVGREAMAGLLPDAVRLSRRKSNLAPFYHRSLADADLPLIREILGSKRLEIEPWVDHGAVRALIERPPAAWESGWAEWQTALWGCLTAETWLRSLSDSTFVERLLMDERVANPGFVELSPSPFLAPT